MWFSLTNGSIRILRCCVTRRPTIPTQLSRFPALHLLENTVLNNTMSSFSSFAHSNRSGGRGQDMKYDRESSGGRGGSKDKIDALGRLLTRILRHMATELNLNMRSDGYVKVEDLLKLNMRTFANIPLRSQTVDDIKEAVRKDNKQRFSLVEENGELLIRANQGHTVMTVESERLLKQIVSADEVQFCVHGTYKRNLESILESGLKRMKRLHVHFSSGLPTDGEVISGMRRDVNVLIYLDVRKALEACKQGKNRERTSKNGSADELNRGYFDDMSELKQHGGKIALANKILIPGIAARKFPAVDVIYSDGRKSKLPIVFDASGVDASKLAVPEASLVCLSFRANSQAMVDSWSKPFYDTFSESKSVQLYEVSFIDSWLLCLNPIKRLLLQFMRKSSDGAKDALQRHIVYSFGDHYYFRKELKILNLLTGYIFLLDKFGRIRWQGFGFAKQEELSSLIYCTKVLLEEK